MSVEDSTLVVVSRAALEGLCARPCRMWRAGFQRMPRTMARACCAWLSSRIV